MKLSDAAEMLATDIAFWMQGLNDPEYPLSQLGELSLSVGSKLRSVGIILLLTEGDSDGFLFNLVRGARAWRNYLTRVHEEAAIEDHHFCAGRFVPLLDAIAAGHWELAAEITRLVPSAFREGHEYEDDFCFAQLVSRLIPHSPVESDDVVRLFGRLEAYLDGDSDPRLAVVAALADRDQSDFDEAFDQLLQSRQLQIEDDKERGQLEEPVVVAQRHVFVEGLAFLRLAERAGLGTEEEYEYCPSLARTTPPQQFPES